MPHEYQDQMLEFIRAADEESIANSGTLYFLKMMKKRVDGDDLLPDSVTSDDIITNLDVDLQVLSPEEDAKYLEELADEVYLLLVRLHGVIIKEFGEVSGQKLFMTHIKNFSVKLN